MSNHTLNYASLVPTWVVSTGYKITACFKLNTWSSSRASMVAGLCFAAAGGKLLPPGKQKTDKQPRLSGIRDILRRMKQAAGVRDACL